MSLCEEEIKKIGYPKSVFFIFSNEFCEGFSFGGLRTILALYFTIALKYDTNTSTELYHAFSMLCFFFPLIGAIIADSILGNYRYKTELHGVDMLRRRDRKRLKDRVRTIFYLTIIYALGNMILALGAVPILSIPHRAVSLLGLLFIAVGAGGMKPCLSSFGGEQFFLPQQSLQLQQFFSFIYFSISAGSTISTFITPLLRNDVKCFGQNNCFSLAFGVQVILMIVSVVIFMMGKRFYRMKKPEVNVTASFVCCIARALNNKINGKNFDGKINHWLEYAKDKYTKEQISDFQAVLNVLSLFLPVPLFWALLAQQGSRWVFQATNMDGRIFGFTLKPDQIHVVNPILVLVFIPLFELYIYPLLRSIGLKRPLQKLVIGGFLAALSFIISAAVEYKVQNSYGVLPVNGEAHLRIFNSLDCNVTLNPSIQNVSSILPLSTIELHISSEGSHSRKIIFGVDSSCPYNLKEVEKFVSVYKKKIVSYFVSRTRTDVTIVQPTRFEDLTKDNDGEAKIWVFYGSIPDYALQVTLQSTDDPNKNPVFSEYVRSNTETDFVLIPPGNYHLISNCTMILSNLVINPGEVNTIVMRQGSMQTTASLVNMLPPNKVHMLWQLPQIMVITVAEIMFSITGLEFSFTQAPPSMKSVLSSVWLLTVAFGNLIVVIISKLKFFDQQMYEFLLFAGLMMVDMVFLIILCVRYKYIYFSTSHQDCPVSKHNSVDLNSSQMARISTLSDAIH